MRQRTANVPQMCNEIWIPGERELRARERSLREGVRLLPSTYRALVAYGQEKRLDLEIGCRFDDGSAAGYDRAFA